MHLQAYEELEVVLAKYNICIAVKEKLVKDSGVAEEEAYDSIIIKLQTKPRAKGKKNYNTYSKKKFQLLILITKQIPVLYNLETLSMSTLTLHPIPTH